jgi:hypothetical protein
MTNKKVAVCISGQLRLFKKTYQSIYDNLIVPNNADVFIHTWFDKDNLTIDSRDAQRQYAQLDPDDDINVIKLYQPKKYLIEKPKKFHNKNLQIPDAYMNSIALMMKDEDKNDFSKVFNKSMYPSYSMFYSIYKCNELKELFALENDIIYDYVVRIRFDIALPCNIQLSNFDINGGICTPNNLCKEELPCDLFFFGDNTSMNVASSVFMYIEYLNNFKYFPSQQRAKNYHYPSSICTWGNEHLIKDICKLFNIEIKYESIPINLLYS